MKISKKKRKKLKKKERREIDKLVRNTDEQNVIFYLLDCSNDGNTLIQLAKSTEATNALISQEVVRHVVL